MNEKDTSVAGDAPLKLATGFDAPAAPAVPMLVFIAVFAMGPAAFQIFLPALPAISKQFLPRPEILALTVSLATAAFAFATLAYGSLIDRFGRRNFLLFGCLLLCAGSVVCATATSIEILILGRIMQSAGGAAGVVVSRTVAMDLYRGQEAMRVLSNLAAASVIVPMGATFVGGLLAEHLNWRFNFVAIAALAAIVLMLAIRLLPETRPAGREVGPWRPFSGYGRLLRTRTFLCFAVQNGFALGVNAVFMVAMPLLFARERGFTSTGIGLVFVAVGLAFFIGTMASTRLPLQRNRRAWILGSVSASAVVALIALLLIAGGADAVVVILAAMLLINIANGLVGGSVQAGAIRALPGLEGSASGMFVFAGSLAMAGMMQLWSVVIEDASTGFLPTMGLMAACSVVSMLCILLLPRDAARG